jgi:hypothetical protein
MGPIDRTETSMRNYYCTRRRMPEDLRCLYFISIINLYLSAVHLMTDHEGPQGEFKYSPTLSLSSALDRGGCKRHAPAALPRETPGTHWIAGWVDLTAILNGRAKISPTPVFDHPDRPARSESLYQLSYRGPFDIHLLAFNVHIWTNSCRGFQNALCSNKDTGFGDPIHLSHNRTECLFSFT